MYNTTSKEILKYEFKKKLRYNEYYDTQDIFDELYRQSLNGKKFKNLYDLILSDRNILLAYRNIKRNTGSNTAGTNKKTIKYWEDKDTQYFIDYIKSRFQNYVPQKVRRVEIPKPNGKTRPLGIPNIEDRIIQQCIKQILEPIFEAKFHNNSYGFRPNRGTSHAIAHVYRRINLDKNYYVVNIDIKSFFDEVNHSKLLKQLWSLGIRDKRLLSIISKMLKAEIDKEGIPNKGVPQGGILSPLLANVVLNEFDWWISDQWLTYETPYDIKGHGQKHRHLRKSKLKEIYLTRYADDFLIFCKNKETADKIFYAIKDWLSKRLNLKVNEEKSEIIDVRKKALNYLGFKIKAFKKSNKWTVKSHISDKSIKRIIAEYKEQVKNIKSIPNDYNIYKLNRFIVGIHNYYQIATEVNIDFNKIKFKLFGINRQPFKQISSNKGTLTQEYIKRYSQYNHKKTFINNCIIYPIQGIKTKPPMLFSKDINNYTQEGRNKIHKKIGYIDFSLMNHFATHPVKFKSIEYNDNRLSLYSGQKGICPISKYPLDINAEVHHIQPISLGGTDEYKNLIMIDYIVHKLIHVKDLFKGINYIEQLKLDRKAIRKINNFRISVGNTIIDW